MNFKELKRYFVLEITPFYGEEEALSIFYISLEQITNWGRHEFIKYSDEPVHKEHETLFNDFIKALKFGTPIQYITGETFFYGLKFCVNPSVLIPRPETEELVEWIISKIGTAQIPGNVLDIGTGSGCIAISLKKSLPPLNVYALDISPEALSVARNNSILNKTDVNFIEADILNYSSNQIYDIIVSNPPYIKENEKADMHQNVLNHEPHLALFVDDSDPLVFYAAIADFAKQNLQKGGLLFFEINEFLPSETVSMLSFKGFKKIELKKDMQGKSRMICCSL